MSEQVEGRRWIDGVCSAMASLCVLIGRSVLLMPLGPHLRLYTLHAAAQRRGSPTQVGRPLVHPPRPSSARATGRRGNSWDRARTRSRAGSLRSASCSVLRARSAPRSAHGRARAARGKPAPRPRPTPRASHAPPLSSLPLPVSRAGYPATADTAATCMTPRGAAACAGPPLHPIRGPPPLAPLTLPGGISP